MFPPCGIEFYDSIAHDMIHHSGHGTISAILVLWTKVALLCAEHRLFVNNLS